MKISGRDLEEQVLVVAEIGNNHEGDFEVAKRLVEAAAGAGADAVKFQTYRTELFIGRSQPERFNRFKSFELTYDQFEELAHLARSLGVLFISTPLDLESAEFLTRIVDAFKVASGDNTFYPLIAQISRTGKPVIISTGLIDIDGVSKVVQFVKENRPQNQLSDDLIVLHCVSSYPVPSDQANLAVIPVLAAGLDVLVGYSDHTMGIDAAVAGVALGARLVEKHFTLDRNYSEFRDHKLSADPQDLRHLVERIRLTCSMRGDGKKTLRPCEEPGVTAHRRSIVAGRDLEEGHRIEMADLNWVRPGGELNPGQENLLVGKVVRHRVRLGDPLRASDVK